MTRPITFPKTSDTTWINAETGVRIVKRHPVAGGGYRVYAPNQSMDVAIVESFPTRSEALKVAKQTAEAILREADVAPETSEGDFDRQWQTFVARVRDYRKTNGGGTVAARIAVVAELEAEAHRDHYAREFYAHAGYGTTMTDRELRAGYADWDAGNASEADTAEAYAHADFKLRRDDTSQVEAWSERHDLDGMPGDVEAAIAEDEALAYQEHYYRLMGEAEAGRRTLPPDALQAAYDGRYDEACQFIYSWRKSVAFAAITTGAPLCLRMTGAHIQHMTADPNDPTCRDTTDLHPVDEALTPAEMRDRGLIGEYMWPQTRTTRTA